MTPKTAIEPYKSGGLKSEFRIVTFEMCERLQYGLKWLGRQDVLRGRFLLSGTGQPQVRSVLEIDLPGSDVGGGTASPLW